MSSAQQWCCDTSAIYRERGQTCCSTRTYLYFISVQLSVLLADLSVQINIQTSCAAAPYLNKILKKPQLHILSAGICYLFPGLDADS